MKKKIVYLVLLTFLFIPICVNALEYSSDEKISIKLPDNWHEVPLDEERDYIDAKFKIDDNSVETIAFGVTDFYKVEDEFKNYNRKDINTSLFTKKMIKEMFGDKYRINKIEKENIGGHSFWTVKCDIKSNDPYYINGKLKYQTHFIPSIMNLNVTNGYMIMILHSSFDYDDSSEMDIHNAILESLDTSNVDYNSENSYSKESKINWNYILVGIFLTLIIYTIIPILIKIFSKKEIAKETAKKIALINSIVLGIIFCIITSILKENVSWNAGPAILYYGVNYFILTRKIKINNSNREIKKLKKLLNKNLITEEEYNKMVKRIK